MLGNDSALGQPLDKETTVPALSHAVDADQVVRLRAQATDLAAELKRAGVDTATVQRLEDLVADLDNPETPWLHLDLRAVFDAAKVTEQVRQGYTPQWQGWRQFVNCIELLRNVLTVVPIALTWHALRHAVRAYEAAVQLDATIADVPFLILWETGFQGQLADVLRLSRIAGWDVFILVVILILSLIVHLWNDIISDQQHRRALDLGRRLDSILWALDKYFAPRRFKFEEKFNRRSLELISSVEEMRQQLEAHSHHFERMTQLELQRLTELRQEQERQLRHQKEFMDGLKLVTDELRRTGEPMHALFSNFHDSVRAVQQQIHTLAKVEEGVRAALAEYNHQLQSVAQNTAAHGTQLRQTAERMAMVTETASKKVGDFSEAVQSALDQTQTIAEAYQQLRAAVAAEHAELTQAAKYIHHALSQLGPSMNTLNSLIGKLEPVASKLDEAAAINHLASDRFGEFVEDLQVIRATLDGIVNHLQQAVPLELLNGLSDVALKLAHIQELLEPLVRAVPAGAFVPPANLGDGPTAMPDNLMKSIL